MTGSRPLPDRGPPHRYVQRERCRRCSCDRIIGEPGWRCCAECDWDEMRMSAASHPPRHSPREDCPRCHSDRVIGEPGWRCCAECDWDEIPPERRQAAAT